MNAGIQESPTTLAATAIAPNARRLSKERWIDSQKNILLNVGYFHVVFTIPDTLNTLVFQNQKELYTIWILFKLWRPSHTKSLKPLWGHHTHETFQFLLLPPTLSCFDAYLKIYPNAYADQKISLLVC